jgi:hypothetical protein
MKLDDEFRQIIESVIALKKLDHHFHPPPSPGRSILDIVENRAPIDDTRPRPWIEASFTKQCIDNLKDEHKFMLSAITNMGRNEGVNYQSALEQSHSEGIENIGYRLASLWPLDSFLRQGLTKFDEEFPPPVIREDFMDHRELDAGDEFGPQKPRNPPPE